MLDEETHKKEIVRMWDTLRGDEFKGQNTCHGVACKDCPFNVKDKNENKACLFDTIFNIIENWSEEHPQEYKVSKLEYDILESIVKTISSGLYFFECDSLLMSLLEKGYFDGATLGTDVKEYFKNCEVDCELGGNENVKRRKI